MREIKHELVCFTRWDATGMETHLEQMAAKGWMLESVSGLLCWKYRRCEPQELHFSVLFDTGDDVYQPQPTEHQGMLSAFCEHAGWHQVASNAEMQVFVNEQKDPVPIYTDPQSRMQDLERIARRTVFSTRTMLLVSLPLFLLLLNQWHQGPIEVLLHTTSFASAFFLFFWVILNAAELTSWYRWRHRARQAAVQGEILPTCGHSPLYGILLTLTLVCVLTIPFLLNAPANHHLLILLLAGMAAIGFLINHLRDWLRKKRVDADTNRGLTAIADYVLYLLLALLLIFLPGKTDDAPSPAAEAAPPLTAQTLTGTEDTGCHFYQKRKESLFLAANTVDQYTPADDGTSALLPELRYTVYDFHVLRVRQHCLEQLLHSFDSENDEHPGIHYQEVDAAPWGANQVRQLSEPLYDQEHYLLCWPDRIVDLETAWALDARQMALAGAALAPEPS